MKIALFENFIKTQNGDKLTYGVMLKRTYKDDKGEYQDAKSFQEGDIPQLTIALTNAAAWIDAQERK